MDLVRCQNNHFYDSDKYDKCPHCEKARKKSEEEKPQEKENDISYISQDEPSSANLDIEKDKQEIEKEDDREIEKKMASKKSNHDKPDISESDDMGATMNYYDEDLVVGWLVAIEGNHRGEAFNLKAGMNYVGRGTNMDVCLIKDQSVSRNKHVTVIFDAVNSEFVIHMGESKELVYINNELLLSPVKLKDRDRILIGKTLLVFVPFCNDEFSWDEGK